MWYVCLRCVKPHGTEELLDYIEIYLEQATHIYSARFFVVCLFVVFIKCDPFKFLRNTCLNRDGNSGDSHLGKQVNWKLN